MKYFTLSILATLFSFQISFAQVLAGDVPPGMVVTNPVISLSNSITSTAVSDSLDIDLDGVDDVKFTLYNGPTIIDGANSLKILIKNPLFSFCTHDTAWSYRVVQYSFNDLLDCNFTPGWISDTLIFIGDYGCMGCAGPGTATDKYFAYQKGSDIGWIKFSYDIVGQGSGTPLTFQVFEMVSEDTNIGIAENAKGNLNTYPNPTTDGYVALTSNKQIAHIQVFNVLGSELPFDRVSTSGIQLPENTGIYFVRSTFSDGSISTVRVVRR